jgi:O-antigen/teichoic acid export membrane protein
LGAAYFMQAMLPVLSACKDRNRLKELYQKAFDILLLMALPMLVAVLVLAPFIVGVMAGPEFGESIGVLRILVFATFIAYFNHLTGFTIVALKKQRPYFLVTVVALVFNVLANLILIPRFSYKGAAEVTILTEGLVLIITTIFIFRLLKIIPSLVKFPQTALEIIKQKGKIF